MSNSIEDVSRPRATIAIAIVFAIFIASSVVIRGRSFEESALIVGIGAAIGLIVAMWQRRRGRSRTAA